MTDELDEAVSDCRGVERRKRGVGSSWRGGRRGTAQKVTVSAGAAWARVARPRWMLR